MSIDEFIQILIQCNKNCQKFEELLKNKKGFEGSKKIIEKIMKESIFEIKYIAKKEAEKNETKIHEGYNLRCLFQNQKETKTYSEILNLQQLASLCQNKEKKEELQYLNNYIELIENLKDILNIISIITNMGYPNYFEFIKISLNNLSMAIKEL